MKKAIDATVEELIVDLAYFEDNGQTLQVCHDGAGMFFVQSMDESYTGGCGSTLSEALIAFGRNKWSNMKELDFKSDRLDWSELI